MNNDAGEPPFERPEHNIKVYVSLTKLPEMTLGEAAPPIIPPGHKAHLNHLHVQPERYRKRLCNLISCRDLLGYDRLVRSFVQRLPTLPLAVPPQDRRTGAAFTIPVHGLDLNVPTPHLPHPTTIYDLIPWMYAYPFPTLTRVMQVSFPRAASWDLTPSPTNDMDTRIWQTFVWRKSPSASNLENYYNQTIPRPASESSLIICMQPEWVLTEADIASFKNVNCFPLYSEGVDNPAYKSAYRIWAKLWDLCVRAKCRFWVLTSYQQWIFGSFSKRFQAGHIFSIKSFDSVNPTVMETLVFHTAKSMGLANDLYLEEYFDSTDDDNGPPEHPLPHNYPGMEFPNSDSEWEGMDDVPDISAGVSEFLDVQVSAYGSQAYVELPVVRVFRPVNDDIHNRRAPRRPSPPVAGPSQIRPRVTGTRRTRSSSYVAGVGSPQINHNIPMNEGSDEDDSDVELNNVQPVPPPPRPIRRQYFGVSRATTEVTDNVVSWTDTVETDLNAVEDLLQVDGIEDENPNAITHSLGHMEAVYRAALETVNPNGGHSLSVPQPQPQTIHSHRRNIGGYLTVIPEVGVARGAEEAEEARQELRRDRQREVDWAELERNGVPMEGDGAGHNPDDMTWISQTGFVSDRPAPAAA